MKTIIATMFVIFVLILVMAITWPILGDQITDFEGQAETSTNTDNITILNGTAVSLTQDNISDSATFSCVNSSNGSQTLPTTNYTVQYTAGTVTLIENSWNNSVVNCSYTYYTDRGETYLQAGEDLTDSFNAVPERAGTIITVTLVTVILMAIGGVYVFFKKSF